MSTQDNNPLLTNQNETKDPTHVEMQRILDNKTIERPTLPRSGAYFGTSMNIYMDIYLAKLDEFADWYEAKIDRLEARIVELENK